MTIPIEQREQDVHEAERIMTEVAASWLEARAAGRAAKVDDALTEAMRVARAADRRLVKAHRRMER